MVPGCDCKRSEESERGHFRCWSSCTRLCWKHFDLIKFSPCCASVRLVSNRNLISQNAITGGGAVSGGCGKGADVQGKCTGNSTDYSWFPVLTPVWQWEAAGEWTIQPGLAASVRPLQHDAGKSADERDERNVRKRGWMLFFKNDKIISYHRAAHSAYLPLMLERWKHQASPLALMKCLKIMGFFLLLLKVPLPFCSQSLVANRFIRNSGTVQDSTSARDCVYHRWR